jgi:ABC-type taurine transport system substrate-binding protein
VGIGGLADFGVVAVWQADNAMAAATDKATDWRTMHSGDSWIDCRGGQVFVQAEMQRRGSAGYTGAGDARQAPKCLAVARF